MTKAETFIEEKLLRWLEIGVEEAHHASSMKNKILNKGRIEGYSTALKATVAFIKEHETEWREE